MAGGTEFSPGKFKELILYLAERSSADVDPRMGGVKLNKLLYRADFEAFRLLGHSITGATYIKGEYGPMAKELPEAEDELERRGYLGWLRKLTGDFIRKVPIARERADTSQFPPEEMDIIEKALKELVLHGGRSVSAWSHEQSSGWRSVGLGKEIPYASAFVSTEPLSDAQMVRALERSDQEGWASIKP